MKWYVPRKRGKGLHISLCYFNHTLIRLWNAVHGIVKTYLVACSQLSQETSRPYQAFVNQTVQQKTRVPDVKCNYDILYTVGPAPCDKNCRSEHKTFFPLFSFSARVWGQDYVVSSSFPCFKMKRRGGNNKETGCLIQLASSTKVNHATRLTTMIVQLNFFILCMI